MRVAVEYHGEEREAVVVIENFGADPDSLIADAAMLAFRPMGVHYPGVRAEISRRLLAPMIEAVMPVIAEVFGGEQPDVADAFYSLVTTPPATLAPIQRLPHFDGVEPGRLALLHYLARDERSGTSFYRHRATGFETVTATRLPAYRAAIEADLAREGLPEPAYIDGDTALFERTARYDGLFNRAILYRGNTLHCAAIPDDVTLSADPTCGRLTLNTFLTV
jgi:hypothetical protein